MKKRVLKVSQLWSVLAITAMLSLPAQSFGLSVASKDIVPADGTTGQDVTTGSGVKTGHIQDGAVTTPKIVDGAVTNSKIVDGSVTTTKIGAGAVGTGNIANGAVTTANIADGSVTTTKIGTGAVVTSSIADGSVINSKIADGAVTTAKIGAGAVATGNVADNAITSSKIANGSITADKLAPGALAQAGYAGMKIVHKGAADGINTFNSVIDALKVIGRPTERNVIIVMPGYYEEDFSSYLVQGDSINVDIVGQSKTGSIIKTIGSGDDWLNNQHIEVPSNMYLRNLTLKGFVRFTDNTNAGITDSIVEALSYSEAWFGIGLLGSPSNITIENVVINALWNGIATYGSFNNGDTVRLNNLQINMTAHDSGATGIYARPETSAIKLSNTVINGAYSGVRAVFGKVVLDSVTLKNSPVGLDACTYGSSVTIRNSVIDVPLNNVCPGNSVTVENSTVTGFTGGDVKIGASRVSGILPVTTSIKYINSFDDNFDPIPNGIH